MRVSSINKNSYSNKNLGGKSAIVADKNQLKLTPLTLQENSFKAFSQDFMGYIGVKSLSNVSFKAKENKKDENPASYFGISLFEKLKANNDLNIIDEVQVFLKENDMEDIKIENLDEIKYKYERIQGGFRPEFTEDMEYAGGTLFIKNYVIPNDPKSYVRTAANIAHELSHAYEHKKNNGLELFRNAGAKKLEKATTVRRFVEYVKRESTSRELMQLTPLEYAINNNRKTGVSISEMINFNPDISKYSTIFPEREVKVDEKMILESFVCENKEDFKGLVCSYFSNILSVFNSAEISEDYKNLETYSLIKNYCSGLLRDEAKAYQINSNVNKQYRGLSLEIRTLNDLIPMTYNMVADALDKIDIEKECL